MPEPPEGWRRIAPVDCIGLPAIFVGYQNELATIARQQGIETRAGVTLTARYERRGDEWHPIPGTLTAR